MVRGIRTAILLSGDAPNAEGVQLRIFPEQSLRICTMDRRARRRFIGPAQVSAWNQSNTVRATVRLIPSTVSRSLSPARSILRTEPK